MNPQIDWLGLQGLETNQLKLAVFRLLRETATAINETSVDDPVLLEVVPRLENLIALRSDLASFRSPLTSLARATGLYNYIDRDSAGASERLLAETLTLPELDGVTLHREQIAALNVLLKGDNLILSAPTSFGKSLLIDALLASGQYRRVAIVLPTIALLDEFRRRLRRRFDADFQVIMHPSDEADDGPVVFLGTQERLINRSDLGDLDLTVVDEFYKLDPKRDDTRCITLNAAVHKLLDRSRQFFFLGPNIDNVHVAHGGRWKFQFLKTRFSTVAIDTHDLRNATNRQERLFDEIENDDNWPALVFVSSPDKANRLALDASEKMAVSDEGAEFADWLTANVGPNLSLIESVRYGFAVHHGRIPRAIASHMIRCFNLRYLPVLFCTSTLIEGVNTAAKTVLIYDKEINRKDYDFFTFSNIRGRAGRLGQHTVGRVFLFNDPPEMTDTDVSPTLFGDESEAPDEYVVTLEGPAGGTTRDETAADWMQLLGLDERGLRVAAQVGLDQALALKQYVDREIEECEVEEKESLLIWSGYPSYGRLVAISDAILSVRAPSFFGVLTAKQLPMMINKLRKAKSMRAFLLEQDANYKGNPDARDSVFKFLRQCEYALPQWIALLELFVKAYDPLADYSFFVSSLSRWFRPEELKNLDEEGIPIQISERFYVQGESREALTLRLRAAVRAEDGFLTAFEKKWIAAALELG